MIHSSLSKRFLAQLFDGIIFLAIIKLSILLFNNLFNFYSLVFYFLFFLIYYVHSTKKYGATLGKKIMNLYVTKQNKDLLNYREAFIREFSKSLFTYLYFPLVILVDVLTIFTNKENRMLHDILSDAIVWDLTIEKKSKYETIVDETENKYKVSFYSEDEQPWIILKEKLLKFYKQYGFTDLVINKHDSWMLEHENHKESYIYSSYKNDVINLEIFNAPKFDEKIIDYILKMKVNNDLEKNL